MVRPRQPVDLIVFKGKKNLTKAEIEERKSQEVKAKSDKVKPPVYLPKELKREFKKIASELVEIGIMTNLDNDALARFLLAKKMYLDVTQAIFECSPMITFDKEIKDENGLVIEIKSVTIPSESYSELVKTQDKLFKQCRSAASDLGLTISSRCKLVIPKKDDKKPKSKEERLFGDRL